MKNMEARDIVLKLPQRFNPAKAEDFAARVHLLLSGAGGGEFTVEIEDGEIRVEEGLHGEADCTVRTSAKTYVNIESGKSNPTMAVMTGKIKVSHIAVLARFIQCFEKLQ